MYLKRYKTMLKEMNDLSKWKEFTCSWIKRYNIVKTATLSKLIYRLNTIPTEIPGGFLAEIELELVLQFIWKCKGPRRAKTILKKNKVAGFALPYLSTTSDVSDHSLLSISFLLH